MADGSLPALDRDARPLRSLFLDLNSYFASVEQQDRPELRGRPVIVVPMDADSTVAIAASYEAKRFGVKTLTRVGDAKRICPDIQVVEARHQLYVQYHNRILEAVDTVLPVEKVCSVDEMRFRLIGKEQQPEEARELALRLKAAISERVGECMRCSIGIAPNAFLAKLGTEMQKPDGLVVLTPDCLEERLLTLGLTDFTGINRRMKARLNAAGIFSTADMLRASPQDLKAAFQSKIGERWWYLLRGFEMEEEPDKPQKSLSHSHVLPPTLRSEADSRKVMARLVEKAAKRLRAEGWVTSMADAHVDSPSASRHAHVRFDATNDGVSLHRAVDDLWPQIACENPIRVGVAFGDLAKAELVTPSLFDDGVVRSRANIAMDDLNRRFGKHAVHLGPVHEVRDTADERIAFNKTSLFSEGKGDNEDSSV